MKNVNRLEISKEEKEYYKELVALEENLKLLGPELTIKKRSVLWLKSVGYMLLSDIVGIFSLMIPERFPNRLKPYVDLWDNKFNDMVDLIEKDNKKYELRYKKKKVEKTVSKLLEKQGQYNGVDLWQGEIKHQLNMIDVNDSKKQSKFQYNSKPITFELGIEKPKSKVKRIV